MSIVLTGRPGSPGVGIGRLVHLAVPSPAADGHGASGDERERLRDALAVASRQLEELAEATRRAAGDEVGAIFEAQALIVRDPALVDPALERIASRGLSAEEALAAVAGEHEARLAALDDEYFRERAADVRDVARRVTAILAGEPLVEWPRSSTGPSVLAVADLGASAVAGLRPGVVAGIAMAGGAGGGHAAIVARALGIPLATELGGALLDLPDEVSVVLDGTGGRLLIDPSPSELASLAATNDDGRGSLGLAPGAVRSSRRLAATSVTLSANVGSVLEAEQAVAAGADGFGLVRTELLYLGRATAPGLDEQRNLYRRIRAAAGGRPVAFRTLDIGGDKPAFQRPETPEANPALGIRGIRLGLRRPELLEVQLRALVEAAAGETLQVMFPMIAVVSEVKAARGVLERVVKAVEAGGGELPQRVEVGIMVEIPSAALLADALVPLVDFLSIGTNDLAQYTLAADRTESRLAELIGPFDPAVLRLVAGVAEAAARERKPVSVCGEAAADPLAAPLLVGMGVTGLSVTPAALGAISAALGDLAIEDCRAAASVALQATTADEVAVIARRLASQSGRSGRSGRSGQSGRSGRSGQSGRSGRSGQSGQ